jgi:hypothetical protein
MMLWTSLESALMFANREATFTVNDEPVVAAVEK